MARNFYISTLLFYFFAGNVLSNPIQRRANADCNPNPSATDDGPTSDQSAGIGVEFESTDVLIKPDSAQCTADLIALLKGTSIGPRSGQNWILTGDTTTGSSLSDEYILDGRAIKIGATGADSVGTAAGAVAARPGHPAL